MRRGSISSAAVRRQRGRAPRRLARTARAARRRRRARARRRRRPCRRRRTASRLRVDQRVRDEDRVVADVGAAQVEQPRDVVERGDEVPRRAGFAHRVAQSRAACRRAPRVACGATCSYTGAAGKPARSGQTVVQQVDVGAQLRCRARVSASRSCARRRGPSTAPSTASVWPRRTFCGEPVDVQPAVAPAGIFISAMPVPASSFSACVQ